MDPGTVCRQTAASVFPCRLTRPRILEQLSDAELAEQFDRAVLAREKSERERIANRRGKFLGRQKVLTQSP